MQIGDICFLLSWHKLWYVFLFEKTFEKNRSCCCESKSKLIEYLWSIELLWWWIYLTILYCHTWSINEGYNNLLWLKVIWNHKEIFYGTIPWFSLAFYKSSLHYLYIAIHKSQCRKILIREGWLMIKGIKI